MNRLERLLYKMTSLLVRFLGAMPAKAREFCAVQMGRLLFAVDRRHRRITMDNLTNAFGKEKSRGEIEAIARAVFVNLIRIVFETAWAMHLHDSQLNKYFHVWGQEDYQKAIAKGKGMLLLGCHFGNWEIQMVMAHLMGMPIHAVYRELNLKFMDRFVRDYRSRYGCVLISNRHQAMRKIYAALRKGFPVGMLMDQCADWYDGVFVDFFDRSAATSPGMAILALKSGAPVLPFFLIRKPDGFHAVLGPELPLIQTGDRTKDIEENTQLYNRVIEFYARKYPDQWFWVHHRYKNRPYCRWPKQKPINRSHNRIP